MGITTSLDTAKWHETVIDILYEWLTDSSCFSSTDAVVVPYVISSNEKLVLPRAEFEIIDADNVSIGAGRGGTESRFKTVFVEITLKATRATGETGRKDELNLVRLGDKLSAYFENTTKGAPALGGAGLRKPALDGPIPINEKNFFGQRFLLSFELET